MFRAEAELSPSKLTDWFYEEKQYCSDSVAWEGNMSFRRPSSFCFIRLDLRRMTDNPDVI